MRSVRVLKYFVVLSIFFFFVGCTHSLDIKNLSSYRTYEMHSVKTQKTIGLVSNSSELTARLIKGTANALSQQYDIVYPYSNNYSRPVDYIVNLDVVPEYKGSGWNFLINFPGFLIFTPAWNGYVYQVNYNLDVSLSNGADKKSFDRFSMPINLDVRHASYNRTWTEVSWLEVGAIALISGIVFIQYDDHVTPLVVDKIEQPVGEYIAGNISKRLQAQGL